MIARRAVAVGADDDAVGLHEVLDRGAFLEELGIGDDVERMRACGRERSRRHALGGADRHGALVDDDAVAVHRLADLPRRPRIDAPTDRRSPLAPSGVPTAMKQISDRRTASARSVVNDRRRSATLRLISSSSPGS